MQFENTLRSLSEILWIPKPSFSADDVPNLSGKVVLVTGGNAGIGKETARVLLDHGAKVYIACRSPDKGAAAVEELIRLTGKTSNDMTLLQMDLANLPTIKSGVDAFLEQEARLDVLILSAGVMWCPLDFLTQHGRDMQFGTNVLGHFYLTQLLLPTLLSTVSSSPDHHVRIVTLSSNSHWWAPVESTGGPVRYETLVDSPERTKLGTQGLYFQSKAGDILIANALARKYGDKGIISISLNPGSINTELGRHTPGWFEWLVRQTFWSVSYGAISSLYAATSPDALQLNGKYLIPWARVRSHRRDLEKVEHQERLWTWCEEEVKQFGI